MIDLNQMRQKILTADQDQMLTFVVAFRPIDLAESLEKLKAEEQLRLMELLPRPWRRKFWSFWNRSCNIRFCTIWM